MSKKPKEVKLQQCVMCKCFVLEEKYEDHSYHCFGKAKTMHDVLHRLDCLDESYEGLYATFKQYELGEIRTIDKIEKKLDSIYQILTGKSVVKDLKS